MTRGIDPKKVRELTENGNGFTTKEILLIFREETLDVLADHEERIRNVEGWKKSIPAVGVLVAFAIGIEFFQHLQELGIT